MIGANTKSAPHSPLIRSGRSGDPHNRAHRAPDTVTLQFFLVFIH